MKKNVGNLKKNDGNGKKRRQRHKWKQTTAI